MAQLRTQGGHQGEEVAVTNQSCLRRQGHSQEPTLSGACQKYQEQVGVSSEQLRVGIARATEGVVTSRAEIASTRNVHFASCFVVEPPPEDEHLPDFAARTTASITDIEQRLKAFDAHKSPGADVMHAAVFKKFAGSLAVPLA